MKKVLLILAALLVTGCASPPLNFSSQNTFSYTSKIDAEVKSVSVVAAQASEATGNIRFNMGFSKTIPDLWKAGIEDSINKSLIFTDSSQNKVNVRVTILEFNPPLLGFSMTTKTNARYVIQDRQTGKMVFDEVIKSEGYVPADYSFLGEKRAVESINRSVLNNINAFMKKLNENGKLFYLK